MKESEFTFLGYRVSLLNLSIQDSFNPVNTKLTQNINIQHKFSDKDNRFVEVIMDITIKSEDDLLSLQIVIHGGFKGCQDMPDKLFKSMYSVNAPAILYPFARAYIASCTSQSGIPAVILPLINLTESNK
ncbi:MAG: protein-export chaperone SecB [bacterium]